jgi:F-type H+-transporting ATPase subunit delta
MATSREELRERAEEVFSHGGADLERVAEELLSFVRLLRAEPQLRKALADITVSADVKKAVLDDLFGERSDSGTRAVLQLLAAEEVPGSELQDMAADLAVQAVLAQAEGEDVLREVEDELFRFARTLDSQPDLRSALTDPVLPLDRKQALLDDLVRGKVRMQTASLLRFIVQYRPERDIGEAILDLADLAAARRERVVVEARTAVPLDEERRRRLAEAISRATGKSVDLEVVEDPDVVGGVVARIGSEVIDGTVRRKLELALETLSG